MYVICHNFKGVFVPLVVQDVRFESSCSVLPSTKHQETETKSVCGWWFLSHDFVNNFYLSKLWFYKKNKIKSVETQ